jgi:hypothetical protein
MSTEDKKKKRPRDLNRLAFALVEEATVEELSAPKDEKPDKNPHAVELGRLGGLRGGKARAAKLSPEERAEIARKAAIARWKKEEETID